MEDDLSSVPNDGVLQAENIVPKGPDEQPGNSTVQVIEEQTDEVISLHDPNEQAEENENRNPNEPLDDSTIQELTEQVEESQPQELSEQGEESQPQELSEPDEENQLQELSEPTEENQLQELSEPIEENQLQELSEPIEENQLQELSEPTEESQLQELSEPDEENQLSEASEGNALQNEPGEEGKPPEISELDEGTKLQVLTEQAEDNELLDLKNLAKEPITIQEQAVLDEQTVPPSITDNQITSITEGQDQQGSYPAPETKLDNSTQLEEVKDSKTQVIEKTEENKISIAKEEPFHLATVTSPLKTKKKAVATKSEGCSPMPRGYFHPKTIVIPKVHPPKTSDKAIQCNKMLMKRLPLLKKPPSLKVVAPKAKQPAKEKDTQMSSSSVPVLKKPSPVREKKKKRGSKTIAKVSSNRVSPSKTHPTTSRKKAGSFSGGASRGSVLMKKGKKADVIYNIYITVQDRWKEINPRYMKETAWEDCVVCSGLSRVCSVFNFMKCGRIHTSKLLFALHTLKILVTRQEMCEALRFMNIDVLGTLNFSEFLEIVNTTSPFAETEGFQNTLWAFRKINKDMVAIDNLGLVLANLEVNLCCEAIQQALKQIHIYKNNHVNFKEFLLAVKEQQRRPVEEAFQTECAMLERRPFQDVAGLVSADSRWRRKYQNCLDDEISLSTSLYSSGQPCSHEYSDFSLLEGKLSCQFDENNLKNAMADEKKDTLEVKIWHSGTADQKGPSTTFSEDHAEGSSKEPDSVEVKTSEIYAADPESTNLEQDLMEVKKSNLDLADQNISLSLDNADEKEKELDITEDEIS